MQIKPGHLLINGKCTFWLTLAAGCPSPRRSYDYQFLLFDKQLEQIAGDGSFLGLRVVKERPSIPHGRIDTCYILSYFIRQCKHKLHPSAEQARPCGMNEGALKLSRSAGVCRAPGTRGFRVLGQESAGEIPGSSRGNAEVPQGFISVERGATR
jgi:hypothetical protein